MLPGSTDARGRVSLALPARTTEAHVGGGPGHREAGMNYKKNGYFKLKHEIIDSNRYRSLSLAAKYLYVTLCQKQNWEHRGKPGDIFYTDTNLFLATTLSERTIQDARKELVDGGFIETSKAAPRKPTRYRILLPSSL